jgi:hypothetical protein
MACGCGCNSNIAYGYNKSCTKQSSGIYFCKEPLCYVKANFVTPAVDVVLEIEVTDSSRLMLWQGIQIGTGYFQIVAIDDANNISIAHSGTATAGLQITAIHPTYGCYQYPITFVGDVPLNWTPTLVGWSTVPPTAAYRYSVNGKRCTISVTQSGASVSNSTSTTISLPIAAATITNMAWHGTISQAIDNSVSLTTPGLVNISTGGLVATLHPDAAGSGWTASGQKLARFQTSYQIA